MLRKPASVISTLTGSAVFVPPIRRMLMAKPRVTALNKIDALDDDTIAERQAVLESLTGGPVHLMSGVSKQGVPQVLRALWSEIAPSRGTGAEDQPEAPWRP